MKSSYIYDLSNSNKQLCRKCIFYEKHCLKIFGSVLYITKVIWDWHTNICKRIKIFLIHSPHEECCISFEFPKKKKKIFLWRKNPHQKHTYQVSIMDKKFPFCVYVLLYIPVEKSFNHTTCAKTDPTKERGKMDHKYTRLNLIIFL